MNRRWLALTLSLTFCGVGLGAVAAGAQAPAPPAAEAERGGTMTYRDPRLGELPPRAWELFVTTPRTRDPGPTHDPKFNVPYPLKLQVRVITEAGAERRFVVHYLQAEDEALARRVGGAMARLYWLGRDYLQRGPSGREYVNVWLRRLGEAGAEEYQGNVYLHAIDEPRAPAEWVRELAHEYSHYLIPRAGPFTQPEEWANGYLGERLFLKWLLYDNGQSHVWDRPIDGAAYVAHQVAPLRDRFLNAGPTALGTDRRPLSARMDEAGMDYFLGEMLALEAAHGPSFLRALFTRFVTPRPQNLAAYVTLALQDMRPARLALDPRAAVPAKSKLERVADGSARIQHASYWLLLPGGDWRLEVSGNVPAGTTAKLEAATLRPEGEPRPGALSWETSLPSANTVWRRLDLTAPAGATAEVREITLTRRE